MILAALIGATVACFILESTRVWAQDMPTDRVGD